MQTKLNETSGFKEKGNRDRIQEEKSAPSQPIAPAKSQKLIESLTDAKMASDSTVKPPITPTTPRIFKNRNKPSL